MSLAAGMVSSLWLWASGLVCVLAYALALRFVPWRVVQRERGIQHLLFGAVVVLTLMWQLRAGVSPGLSVHFLGVAAVTLILGWDLALLVGALALALLSLLGVASWQMLPLNLLCMVIIPASVTLLVLRQVERRLPRNFFVYLFGCAFFGAALAVGASGMSLALVLWLDGVYPWARIYHDYAMYLPLIMLPEGLLNGIIMTGMMVFHPDWIRTFDAKRYIDEQ